tara:strand:- start:37 stop:285 length:249 start_codon:yes stop_codon:yes gene_type:complete
MKLGNKIYLIPFLFFIYSNISIADDKIISTPLVNIDEIKPSFEEVVEENETQSKKKLKEKGNNENLNSSQTVLIGLDKITAK